MELMIRDAVLADCPVITRLNREEMGYDYPVEKTVTKLQKLLNSPSDRIFVAAIGDSVVGYIHVHDYDVIYAPHIIDVLGIAVATQYRRMGIGRSLLKAAEEWALQDGAESIRLVSGATRVGAHAFYQSCGYLNYKTQINFKKHLQTR